MMVVVSRPYIQYCWKCVAFFFMFIVNTDRRRRRYFLARFKRNVGIDRKVRRKPLFVQKNVGGARISKVE